MKDLKIGLFGFGVVGEGIYKVLSEKPALGCAVAKIVIRHPEKTRDAPSELFSTNANDILQDPSIDVVVELIDDAEAAFQIVKQAMQNGKSVVSANKKMIAENHKALLQLQTENKVSFLYEAAVCGSVPILRNLEEYFDNDLLKSVGGIVNGSTNYILTKMKDENACYASSLKAAQENGFAESNPELDVAGFDAAFKLSIMTLHAFGKFVDPKTITRKGITALHSDDFKYAFEKGLVIKLLASSIANESEEEITTNVFPTFIRKESALSSVNNEYNGVIIGSTLADEQFLYGKGAGRFPTSSAVLSDISALKYGYKYSFKKGANAQKEKGNNASRKFYIAANKKEAIDLNIFDSVDEQYTGKERAYAIGDIQLEKLKGNDFWKKEDVSLIAFN